MNISRFAQTTGALAIAAALAACSTVNSGTANKAAAEVQPVRQPLATEVFNPGEKAIFAVSSVLVLGQKDAVLIDAQFSAEQARHLADRIKASGRRLTTIYVSHGDPDYYFGLDTLRAAFPDARIVATPGTIAHIEKTRDAKLQVWGPKLGANAPRQIIVPEPLKGDTLMLEGESIKVIGLDGPTPARTFAWIPSIKTVVGGVPVMAGEHVWMADTQSPESRKHWLATLDRIRALQPAAVVPGHFVGTMPQGIAAVNFTADYIRAFEQESARAANSTQLIEAMKKRFPNLGGEASLELSAKVAKGEMKWE